MRRVSLKFIAVVFHNIIMYVLINFLHTSARGRYLKFHRGESSQGWGFGYYSDGKNK